jgi:hypothetical protein
LPGALIASYIKKEVKNLACEAYITLFSIKTEPELEIAELEEMLELPETDNHCLAAKATNMAYKSR